MRAVTVDERYFDLAVLAAAFVLGVLGGLCAGFRRGWDAARGAWR